MNTGGVRWYGGSWILDSGFGILEHDLMETPLQNPALAPST